MRSRIAAMGLGLPSKVLTNLEMEKFVDTSDEWIRTRTGIKERRLIDTEKGETHTSLCIQAATQALEKANVKADELDLVICCTITPETWMPMSSSRLVGAIGAKKAGSFDLNSACSGFIAGLHTADAFIRSGIHKKILVVGIDVFSPILDWADRKTCVLFGDGAGAAVVEATDASDPKKDSMILGSYLGTQFDVDENLSVLGGGTRFPKRPPVITMEGQEVFKSGSRAMAVAATEIIKRCGMTANDIDWFIPHQANLRIIEMVAKLTEFPMERVYINVDRWGNTSAGTVAIAMAEMQNSGQLKRGQTILLDVFGGGFTYGAMIIRW